MAIILSVILIFLGIAILVVIHFCIVGRALRRGLEREIIMNTNMAGTEIGSGNGNIGNRSSRRSMSREELKKLPCFEYNNMVLEYCAVCLERFKKGERCRMLPICKHSFHIECVDEWLLLTPICPICRTNCCIIVDQSESSLKGSEGGEIESQRLGDGSLEMGISPVF